MNIPLQNWCLCEMVLFYPFEPNIPVVQSGFYIYNSNQPTGKLIDSSFGFID